MHQSNPPHDSPHWHLKNRSLALEREERRGGERCFRSSSLKRISMHSRRISSGRLCDRIRMTWRTHSDARVHTHISLVPSRSRGRGCWLRAREKCEPLVNETREKGERERETRVARRQLPAETAIGIARGGKREREALAGRRRGRSGGWSTERGKRATEKADWGFWWSNEEATTEGKSVTTLAEREGEKDDNRKSMRSRARITGSTRCTLLWAYMRAHTATRRGQEDWLLINRRKYSRTPACEKQRDYHAESMYIGEDLFSLLEMFVFRIAYQTI